MNKIFRTIILMLFTFNGAYAACVAYTNIPFVNDGFTNPLTNIVVEGYEYNPNISLHSIIVYAESIDYAGSSLACRSFQYLKTSPDTSDNLAQDEFLKFLKLSMTLGYKLRLNNTSGTSIVSINDISKVIISKP